MATKQLPGRRVLRVLLVASSLVTAWVHLCPAAESKRGPKTNTATGESNRPAKGFQFEVVSLRPSGIPNGGGGTGITRDGFRVTMNLDAMIKLAYATDVIQHGPVSDPAKVINLPGWGFWYQIDARVAQNDRNAWQTQGKDQELLRSAMQALLKDRFRLALHEQKIAIPVYRLVVSRKGIRFKPSAPGSVLPPGYKFPDGGVSSLFDRDPNQPAHFYNASVADLLWVMEQDIHRPIEDATGLTGRYDFSLYRQHVQDPDMSYEYLVDKLGLQLKPGRGSGTNLVIDHIERPSPN